MSRAVIKRWLLVAFATLSLFMGATSTGWLVAVANQSLLPWSKFSIFLPDPSYLQPR